MIMVKVERKTIQDLYIRICKDSKFNMGAIEVAIFAANVLNISPFEVYSAFSDLRTMNEVASGEHPAAK